MTTPAPEPFALRDCALITLAVGRTAHGLRELAAACGVTELVQVEGTPTPPLIIPDASWDVVFQRSPAKALEVGMPATPLEVTAADTRAWDEARGRPDIPLG